MSAPPGAIRRPAARGRHTMSKLFPYLRPYRGACLLAPLLMLLEVSMDLMQPRLMASIIDDGVMRGDLAHVGATGALMLLCAALGLVGGAGCTVYSSKAAVGFGTDLRRDLFAATQALSFRELDRLPPGSLITRLGSDVAQLQQFVMMLLRAFVRSPLLVLGSVAMAAAISPSLALILFGVVPVLSGVLFLLVRWSVPLFDGVQQRLDRLNMMLHENLAGIRTVKAFVRGGREAARFSGANRDYADAAIRAWRIVTLNMPALSLVLNLTIVAVLWAGGRRSMAGTMTAGELVAFVNYVTVILSSLTSVGMLLTSFSRAQVAAVRVNEVFDAASGEPVPSGATAAPVSARLPAPLGTLPPGPLEVAFEGVSLRYESAVRPALEDVWLRIPAGATVALFGSTGAGKSTLAALLPRLYDPDAGTVRIGGHDICTLDPQVLRGRIGYVQQETILFSGSVRDNLRFGCAGASDEDIAAAARAAQADDFIVRLPQGYDSVLGQRGINLSGGQKQRLSIARALLLRPSLLILDDSTSAVDLATEARILGGIRVLLPRTTCLLIAQRLSAAAAADLVVVLEQGRVIAHGTHAQLLESSAAYRDIHRSQAGMGTVSHD
ncbi:ABC transporter ATP-binding protein [Thauera linaloolentis]|uniref:ABC transporter ATP-binding protein n=1 Tax=Thauera linaloolentis TaxID=76112 RepID=UPI000319653F|nr:ABC transporter ATP-binding protein [Thauera linaloolentis]MCM8564242.1 ABC transporter ATP-binding protein/permease [Thauera linaloolentis]